VKKPATLRLIHGSEGKIELGIVEVDDPLYAEAAYREEGKPQAQIALPANLFSDVFMYLFKHGHLNRWQYLAAVRFMALVERIHGRGAPAMDTTKEPVDGRGGQRDPFLEGMQARQAIYGPQGIKAELGRRDFEFMVDLMENSNEAILFLKAEHWRKREALVKQIGGILEILAIHFGYGQPRQ
jgi:hypothetical protein